MNRSPVSAGYAVHVFVYLIRKIISDWDMADARQKDRLLTKEGKRVSGQIFSSLPGRI